MALTSDPVANEVAANAGDLLEHGAVRIRGYVHVIPAGDTFRVYTSPSFDRWLEIPKNSFRSQLGPSPENDGRSLIWIRADAVVTRCQAGSAAYIVETLDEGYDDPTARPRGGGG